MKKKIFLTSAAMITISLSAFAFTTKNPNNISISYDAVLTNGVSPVQTISGSYDEASKIITVSINQVATYNGANEVYSLTALSHSGRDIDMNSWQEKNLSEATNNDPVTIATGDFLDDSGNIAIEDEDYKEYVRIMEIVKTSSTFNSSTMYEKNCILTGKEILARNPLTGDDIPMTKDSHQGNRRAKPFINELYYVCQVDKSDPSYFYYAYQIQIIIVSENTKKNCTNSYVEYNVTSIPNNFINENAQTLSIPAELNEIASNAFANASSLSSISTNNSKYVASDDNKLLFERENGEYTLIFACASASNGSYDWTEEYVGIKPGALKFVRNLTINTLNTITYEGELNNNQIIKKASTKELIYTVNGTTIYDADGALTAEEMSKIVVTASDNGCTYVDMTGADVTEDLDIDAICEANSKDFSNLNTIFFFPASTHNVTGKNVVVNGNCANLVLTEAADFFSPYDFDAASVTYNRTISTNWSTISLPFDVNSANATTLKATCNFGDLYSYSAVNNEFTFAIKDVMTAYTPYIIQSSSDVVNPTFSNVNVAATTGHVENSMERDGASFCSTMSRKQLTATNETSYFFFKDNLVYAVNKGTVKPFRCFMSAPAQPAAAGSLRIIDAAGNEMEVLELDNTTYIETISKDVKNDVTYNLNGQKVENNNGLMVKKGSKMIIK